MQRDVGNVISHCLICKTYCSASYNAALKLVLLWGKGNEIRSLVSFVQASEKDGILLCSKQMWCRVVRGSRDPKCVTVQVQMRASQTETLLTVAPVTEH